MFHLRNELNFSYRKISLNLGLTIHQVAGILTKPLKYKSVKSKYNLKLTSKFKKEFNKEDVIKIHNLYEDEKFSVSDISRILELDLIKLRHLIYNQNIYRIEKEGLAFNIEKNRKSKTFKRIRKKGIKFNKTILAKEIVIESFNLKYNYNLTNQEISEKLKITKKDFDLILTFRYQRRKYNEIYLNLKTIYDLRIRKNILSKEDIINIFCDYNSGNYLIEDLNLKYNYSDVGILLSNYKRLSTYYQEIIKNNNLKVDKSLTKNSNLKSKAIINRNKQKSKKYKLTDPSGIEYVIKNLSEFCSDKYLDPANLSRSSKNGRKHKGWSCICLD
jgi:hypothetical protein